MNRIEKRDFIHSYLYQLNDKDLDEIFNKVKSVVENEIVLTLEQEKEIEQRVMRHKNGESRSYSWNEVKTRAKSGV